MWFLLKTACNNCQLNNAVIPRSRYVYICSLVIRPFDRNYVSDETIKTKFNIANEMNVTDKRNNIYNIINTINYTANN